MSPAGGHRLVVTADLTVRVSAPDGRSAVVVVGDRDGVVRVDVDDVGALLASLPRTPVRGPGLRAVRAVLGTLHELVVPVWDQPVDVAVGEQVVLRRRDGRWLPTRRVVVPAVGLLTLLTLGLAGLLALLRRLLRRRR